MKLLLFEPFLWNDINDYPDLGSAMLVGACKKERIDIQLVPTQRKYLHWFFNDIENVIALLKRPETKRIRPRIDNLLFLHKNGERFFHDSLRRLYTRLTVKNWQNFLDGEYLIKAITIFKEITALNEYFLYKKDITTPIIKNLINLINQYNPEYIGLSFYNFSPVNLAICKALHENLGKIIIVGGSATNHLSVEGIRELYSYKCIDYLIIGPGEKSLPGLIENLDNKGKRIQNKGGVFDFKGGLEINNKFINEIIPISKLDKIALPDFSMSQIDKYCVPEVVLPLQFARGCSWRKCVFCAHHKGYLNNYKNFSNNKIVETLLYYQNKYNCRHIMIHDEEVSPYRLESICKELIKNRLFNFKFLLYARPVEGFTDIKRLNIIKKGGVAGFSWGVESGSQKILSHMNKGTNIVTINKILKLCSDIGISSTCWLIVGFPTENKKDIKATLQFIGRNNKNVDLWLLSPFVLQKDSAIAKNPEKWGISVTGRRSHLKNTFYKVKYERRLTGESLRRYEKLIESKITFRMLLRNDKYIDLPISNRSRIIPFLLKSSESLPF